MRIIFFVPRIENCGPVNVVLNIVKELCFYSNISITIISLRKKRLNSAEDYSLKFKEIGIENIVYLDKYHTFLEKLLFLNKIVKEADLIHSHGFFPDLYSSLIKRKIFKVSTAHSVFLRDYQLTYGIYKGSFFAFLHHLVYLNRSFDYIVGCSGVVSNYLKKSNLFNKSKIITIHNAVSIKKFKRLELTEKLALKQNIFDRLKINRDLSTKVFVYSGALTTLKQVPELIEWFLKLPNSDNILFILGDGRERKKCEEVARGADNIFFLGFVNETSSWYQIGDYIISNSSLEGFPMSILEGMACGCRALLSDIPAHRELIEYFPSLAMPLSKDFLGFNDVEPSKTELSHLSSTRMASQYLNIYNEAVLNFKINNN